jgi:hypothetical protein
MEDSILKINLVKADSEICFISDCMATDGYDYNYFKSKLTNLYFDGKLPTSTFTANWYQIEKYPTLIQRKVSGKRTNERYEIKDEEMISKKLPQIITVDEKENYSYDVRENFYKYKYDTLPPTMENVEVELNTILEVDNFKAAPVINYKAIQKWDYSDKPYEITNANVKHQLLDKMIFPEVLLASRPCSFSSKQVYDITRQYVRDHIDGSKAKITSDYDFCFTVRKIVPLIEPETVSYQNIFARTKKERNKIHYKTKKFNEVDIFEMTHDQSRYQNYTVIKPIFGENEEDLKNKMDEWLSTLIEIINKPLEMCSHCNGTGMVENIKRINQNDVCK